MLKVNIPDPTNLIQIPLPPRSLPSLCQPPSIIINTLGIYTTGKEL